MAFLSFHTKLRFLGKVQRESIVSIFHWDTNCFDAFIGKPPDDVQKEKLLSRLGFEILFFFKKNPPKKVRKLVYNFTPPSQPFIYLYSFFLIEQTLSSYAQIHKL